MSKGTLLFLILITGAFSIISAEEQDQPIIPWARPTQDPFPFHEIDDDDEAPPFRLPFGGFIEYRAGGLTQRDRYQGGRRTAVNEILLRFNFDKAFDWGEIELTTDMAFRVDWRKPKLSGHDDDDDDEDDDDGNWDLCPFGERVLGTIREPHFRAERGWFDLRSAAVTYELTRDIDIKAGRQILTWGTGDMLYINDTFPKDYVSLYRGREFDYIYAPTNAIKLSRFGSTRFDLVFMPVFVPDRFADGRRISYWNDSLGRLAGRDDRYRTSQPEVWFRDHEVSARLSQNISDYELAAYGHRGFWKSPAGWDRTSGKAIFPELAVYGGSLRGPIGKGTGNVEVGYYDSLDDPHGSHPLVRNSEWRIMTGYSLDVMEGTTIGMQYYVERMMRYNSYRRSLPQGAVARDEDRHIFGLRLTQGFRTETRKGELSLLTLYSPTDEDGYVRPSVTVPIGKSWWFELGSNIFWGRKHTHFGQFEKSTNVYCAMRFEF